MKPIQNEILPRGLLIAYGLPSLPLALLAIPFVIYLPPFYGSDLKLGLAAVGQALLLARLWDVATDPIIGILSDRLKTPIGRRRPWVLFGIPVLLLGTWRLLMPPADVSVNYMLVWSLVSALGWTMISLPYNAWSAELSFDYHERARIFSVTHGFAIVGTILGIIIPGFIQISGGTRVTALATVAWLILIMLPLSSLGLLFRVPEQSSHYVPVGWNQSFKILRKNEPLRRLLLAYLLNGVANGLPASLFLLFVQSVIGGNESRAGILLLCYFGAGLAGLPIWLMLARRLGKHQVWCLGMLMACLAFIWVPWLGPGEFKQFLLICLFSGLTLGADLALPAAIQADVIDEDTVHSGSSQAGLYFALWGMATKLALALAVGISYPLLGWFGFSSESGPSNTGIHVLGWLYGGLPVLIKLVAVAAMWHFPLNESRQRELRARITQQGPGAVHDPKA